MSASKDKEESSPRLAETMLYTSEELSSGSPSIYRLRMRDEMRRGEAMIARQSIGKPYRIGRGEIEKVFMVVGATGAGKSTLVNGMVNYVLGVQWNDEFRFKLITEESKASQAHSQTQYKTAYTFYPMKGSAVPFAFTIYNRHSWFWWNGRTKERQEDH